jgi:hypothetical protein
MEEEVETIKQNIYLAGIFDSCGLLKINYQSAKNFETSRLEVIILPSEENNKLLQDLFEKKLGYKIVQYRNNERQLTKYKCCIIEGEEALSFLEEIYLFSVTKKMIIEIVIKICKLYKTNTVTTDVYNSHGGRQHKTVSNINKNEIEDLLINFNELNNFKIKEIK